MVRQSRLQRVTPAHAVLVLAVAFAGPLAAIDGAPLAHGFVAFDVGGLLNDVGSGVVGLADGSALLVGTVATGTGAWQMALARVLPNGSLDSDFGSNGRLVNPFGLLPNTSGVAAIELADGRLLVAGTIDWGGGDRDFLVGRLLADGTPDSSFGSGSAGLRAVAFDLGGDDTDALSAMTLDASGRVVVAGSVDVGSGDSDFGVARLTADGALDSSFAGDGKETIPISADNLPDLGLAVTVDFEGRILVCGATWQSSSGGQFDWALTAMLSNGDPDTNFGTYGKLVLGATGGGTNNDFCWALATWPDGEIVAVGDTALGTDIWAWVIQRLTRDGDPINAGFGSFCGSPLSPCAFGPQDSARAVLLQGDDKVVIAGMGLGSYGNTDFGIARFSRQLDFDFDFAGDSTATFDFNHGGGTDADTGVALAFASDGRLLMAGSAEAFGVDVDFAWVRFDNAYIFADGFEWSGGWAKWSSVVH